MTTAHEKPKCTPSVAVDFLKQQRPGGPWTLTAIVPDAATTTETFTNPAAARAFIREHNTRGANVYYHVNLCRGHLTSKARKEDIAAVEYLHVDCDPKPGESPAECKARLRPLIDQHNPTAEIDSGNGVQALFKLKTPIDITTQNVIEDIEARNHALAATFGADPKTRDISRLLRLPGTINYPNAKKRREGRVVCGAKLLKFNGVTYPLSAFPPVEAQQQQKNTSKKDSTPSGLFYRACADLFERGWSVDKVEQEFVKHPKRYAHTSAARYANEGRLSQQIEECFNKWELAHAEDDAQVTEINRTHALVVIGDKTMIMRESEGPVSFLQLTAFRNWFANQHIARGKRMVSLAHYWLEHHRRRQYQGIVFAPGDQYVPPSHFNLWRGFAVEPRAGDCSKFLRHIREVVCCDSKHHYDWVMGWFAQIFQQPDNKLGTSLVLRGAEGAGKTIVGKIIGSLLGTHYVGPVADARWITGRFNAHIKSCLLLHADEAFWAGDKAAEGHLKDLITGTTQFIEFKGLEAIPVANYIRLFVTGNENWLVPAGMDARRPAVLDVAPDHSNDTAYFAAIAAEMNNGGREALLHHLLNFDLTTVDLRKVPTTAALLDQKLASLTPEQGWWLDVLHDGRLPNTAGAANRCTSQDLCEYYLKHATERGVRRRATATVLGRMLHKFAPGLRKGRISADDRPRPYIYTFPPLGVCRTKFSELLKQHIAFDEPSKWQHGLVMGEAAKQRYS